MNIYLDIYEKISHQTDDTYFIGVRHIFVTILKIPYGYQYCSSKFEFGFDSNF